MGTKPLSIFHGEEGFLVEDALNQQKRTASQVEVLESKTTLSDIYTAINTISLLSTSPTLYTMKMPWFLTNAVTDADVKTLESICTSLPSSGHQLTLILPGKKLDGRKKTTTLLKKHATIQEFTPFKDWEQDKLRGWIASQIQKTGKSITPDGVTALEELGGTNLRTIANEIDKLTIYAIDSTEITADDVNAVSSNKASSIFAFNEAMRRRNHGQMITQLTRLLQNGDDPIKLMGLITSNLRLFIQLTSLSAEGLGFQQIGPKIGKNPYFVKNLLQDLRGKYTLDELTAILRFVAKKDLEIKSGRIPAQSAIELCVLKCVKH